MRSYRLDASLPLPARGVAAREAAARVLALCSDGVADGPDAFDNDDLNEALDPLRLHPALGVRCGHCEHGIAYLALNTQGTTTVSGNKRRPPKQRRGGLYDLDELTETPATGVGRGVTGWQADAQSGRGAVVPTGEREGQRAGSPQRRTHTCKKCHRTYTHNNTTLLRKCLAAIARGDNEIRL